MIVQSFRSVMLVGAVAGAALSCYMVSLRVAAERAALEDVESRILLAKRDIRGLDTELTTRGRVRQLERWNVDVLALTAPGEGQFLQNELQLASLTAPIPRDVAPAPLQQTPTVQASARPPKRRAAAAEPILASYRLGDDERDLPRARVVPADTPRSDGRRKPVATLRIKDVSAKKVAGKTPL